jgi:hypothetical protein
VDGLSRRNYGSGLSKVRHWCFDCSNPLPFAILYRLPTKSLIWFQPLFSFFFMGHPVFINKSLDQSWRYNHFIWFGRNTTTHCRGPIHGTVTSGVEKITLLKCRLSFNACSLQFTSSTGHLLKNNYKSPRFTWFPHRHPVLISCFNRPSYVVCKSVINAFIWLP